MITSKTKNENYLGYLILEIIMVTVITFLGMAFLVFYTVGRSDTKGKSNHLEYLLNHPFIYALICIIPAMTANAFILIFRNRNYIVGFSFDDTLNQVRINYRGILNKKISETVLAYDRITTQDIRERKILFNQTYRGLRINNRDNNLKLDFITNNFIWEEQPRERVLFLENIDRIVNDPDNAKSPNEGH